MKIKFLKLFLIGFVLISCGRDSHGQKYREESLLFAYLEKFHSEKIQDNDFFLLTFRTRNTCKTCRKIPLDSILQLAIQEAHDKPLYVLTDDPADAKQLTEKHPTEFHCLYGDAETMDRYGLPKMEPLLFEIQKKRIIRVRNWYGH